jgi:predicted nucleic acid-binding protein
MKTYVLDANAIVRYLSNGADANRVDALVKRAAMGEAKLLISVINWAEVLYSLAKTKGLERATADLKSVGGALMSVTIDESQAESAAIIRLHYRIGLADCFAAALAIQKKATLVTADRDFEKLGNRLKLMRLSAHVK